ncbi:glucose import [Tritrichomonas musculus]|uniref:Glucose import n=1 Tax=Tritrichomonas musculus TaxID=1915356 RepID=A0ABR2H0K8_9EUKA
MGVCGIEFLQALVIMLAPFNFGIIIVYPSPAGADIRAHHHLSNNSFQWSFYNSVSCLFAIAGPFLTKLLLILFHGQRKKTVFVIDIIAIVFWLLNYLTKVNIWAGIVIRAFLGIALGAFSSIGPMYLVEISPRDASGFFGTLDQIAIVTGQVFTDFVGANLSYLNLNFVGAGVAALQGILIWFIKESPVYKKLRNEEEKAINVQNEEKTKFFTKENIKNLLIGVALTFFQQFAGINGILTNLSDIMSSAGLDIDPNYQAGIATLAQVIAALIASFIIDKLGRRNVWCISSASAAVFLLIFALNEKFNWSNVLPLIMVFLYQLGFGLGLGPITWFLVSEYFNDETRPTATMCCTTTNWLFAFIIILIFPQMKSSMGLFGALMFFFAICILSLIFGIFCIYEPKKKNEMDQQSEDNPGAVDDGNDLDPKEI